MISHRTTVITVMALLIVILGAVAPDVCMHLGIIGAPGTPVLAASHSSDPEPECQRDETCFCCAHFVAVPLFVFVGLQNHMILSALLWPDFPLDGTVNPPYLPPRA
jgi:hypothetical protein